MSESFSSEKGNAVGPAQDAAASTATSDWVEGFSKTHKIPYWANIKTGQRQWENPFATKTSATSGAGPTVAIAATHTTKEIRTATAHTTACSVKENVPIHTKVAVIVPFRDLHANQHRGDQMRRFVPAICEYMKSCKGVHCKIFIIEQSDDKRKFNRGKLLNIGFDIARKEGFNSVIFHDVDLIPSAELREHYCRVPADNETVHIARVWDRYNKNRNYFGGVVSFSSKGFADINGFPNNYWGWGGEDDELWKRVVKNNFKVVSPETGTFTDMENMGLGEKLSFLKGTNLKCNNKVELLDEHKATWTTNGLSDLKYEILRSDDLALDDHCVKVIVDVKLNGGHWTDARSGIDDDQLDEAERARNNLKKRKFDT